jgi:probable F420-dependent oxidoreductase
MLSVFMRAFRFGAMTYWANIPPNEWTKSVKHIEKLGYSTLFEADHFGTQAYDLIVLLSAAATATTKLNTGSLVFDVDYRHPIILAKTAAALHLLSKGRFEFGIGAGWDKRDYNWAGIPFDKPITRIKRLDEALTIIRSLWTQKTTTFEGKHYTITEMVQAGELPKGEHPKIMVGGGGKRLLYVAGKHADIVGIQWPIPGGGFSGDSVLDTNLDRVKERIRWVKESARRSGRNVDDIEFQMLFPFPRITDDPEPVFRNLASSYGISVDDVKECPQWLIGSSDFMVDRLDMIRDETGISYMVFGPPNVDMFDSLAEKIMLHLN